MALIRCRECGREISSTAEMCPQCGARTRYGRTVAESKQVSSTATTYIVIASIVSIIGVILIISSFVTMIGDIHEYNNSWYNGYNYKSPLSDHEMGVVIRLVVGIVLDIVAAGFIGFIRTYNSNNDADYMIDYNDDSSSDNTYSSTFTSGSAEGTMTCPVCGAVQRDDRILCMRCGKKFEAESKD